MSDKATELRDPTGLTPRISEKMRQVCRRDAAGIDHALRGVHHTLRSARLYDWAWAPAYVVGGGPLGGGPPPPPGGGPPPPPGGGPRPRLGMRLRLRLRSLSRLSGLDRGRIKLIARGDFGRYYAGAQTPTMEAGPSSH